ncbi:MAG TPA: hypothetical protein VGN26_12280 [Armatimonadota bacterium]|jgi:hypothetical protein
MHWIFHLISHFFGMVLAILLFPFHLAFALLGWFLAQVVSAFILVGVVLFVFWLLSRRRRY